jgi:hypothetical protein
MKLVDHPNMKLFVKNRVRSHPRLPFIIKNDEGQYYEGEGVFGTMKALAYHWEGTYDNWKSTYYVFDTAKKFNAEVFIETLAGDIMICEGDFP